MISDDELLLYYYRDGLDAAERARIGAALAEQPELAQRLHRLVGRLDAVSATPEVPVPAQFQRRWQAALDQASKSQTPSTARTHRTQFKHAPWYAAAAGIVIAVGAMFLFVRQPPVPIEPVASTSTGSAYERGLKTHLASTEQQLASLENATPEQRARLVETIIEQNRIYALAAERAGEPQLARVLRAFSPVLEGLQNKEGDPAADVAQLAFELRVMQGRLASSTASTPASTNL